MGFWKLMDELIDGYTVQLTIRKAENKMIILLVPKLDVKKDEVQREIVPLTISGTPDELDKGFFLAIAEGLSKTSGLQSNIKDYESSLKKADTKAAPKGKAKGIAEPAKKKEPGMFDKKPEEKKEEDVPDNVDTETGEIKEEPKPEPVKQQGNSIKVSKTAKKAEEKPVVEAPKEEKVPFDSGTESSNDDFGDEDW